MHYMKITPVLALLLGIGCSDGSEADGGSSGSSEGSAGKADMSCEGWLETYCRVQDSCGSLFEQECLDTFEPSGCKRDADLERCVPALDAVDSTCQDIPIGCEAEDIVDPTVGISGCASYKQSFCEWFVPCNEGYTQSSCVGEVDFTLDCTAVYALTDDYDTCISDLETEACATNQPLSCTGVLLQSL